MNDNLRQVIENAKSIVFFGGAGVSTESGIPDFRSEKGLYSAMTKYGAPPEELLSHDFFVKNPQIFFDYYRNNLIYGDARPNAAHMALAALEKRGLLKAVITQNIDGLHQLAGSKNIFELHGSVQKNYCTDCGARYGLAYILESEELVPRCKECGGIVRPHVVLYGEMLDDLVMEGAVEAVKRADVLIVGGTSLVVYPAAGLVDYFSGDKLVLINLSATPYDSRADLVINEPIGKALG